MADSTLEHAFFYNSEDGDRVYDATSFEYWLKKFFITGVFSGDCEVTAAGSMTITVADGYANVDGKVKFFKESTDLELETANSSYGRIDSVVIERNDSDRDVTLKIVTGTAAASPTAADPERADGVYQLVLAQIYVAAGATSITQSNITDTRENTDLCGIVTGTVDRIDFDDFEEQLDAIFAEYKETAAEEYTNYIDVVNSTLEDYKDQFDTQLAEIQNLVESIQNSDYEEQIEELEDEISSMRVYINQNAGTVGSSTKPVYLKSGTVTASSSTVGGTSQAVYLKSGTITAGIKVQKGSVTITPVANTPTSKSVTFSSAFSSAPQVVLTPATTLPGTTVLGVGVSDISKTGFTATLTRTNTTETAIRWIAIGT